MVIRSSLRMLAGPVVVCTLLLVFMGALAPLGADRAYAQAGGQISGTVTSAASPGGVENVSVYVLTLEGGIAGAATTALDGTYAVGGLATGDYRVVFFGGLDYLEQWYSGKAGFDSADDVSVTDGSTTAGIDAYLEPAGKISGTVTSASEPGGVENVWVYALDSNGSYRASSPTASDGTYEMGGLATGSYRVRFIPGGDYLQQWYSGKVFMPEADSVSVTEGSTTTGIDAYLVVAGKITGTVTSASEPGGVQNVYVYAYDTDHGYNSGTMTASDGTYELGGLYAGNYRLAFEPGPAYFPQWYDDQPDFDSANDVSVTEGSTTSGIDAVLEEAGQITGTVTSAAEPGGVGGVRVEVTDLEGRTVAGGYTGSDGTYAAGPLTSGSYRVGFMDPDGDYVMQWYDGKDDFNYANAVSVTQGSVTPGIDAYLEPAGRISGTVTSAAEPGGVGGIYIIAFDLNYNWLGSSFTQPDGTYDIGGLPERDYHLNIYGNKDYLDQWYDGKPDFYSADNVSVIAGSTTTGIDIFLEPAGKIAGTVTSASEPGGVDNVIVYARDLDGGYWDSDVTSSDGTYVLGSLETGEYRVEFYPYYGDYNRQWYDAKPDLDSADNVSVSKGSTTTGIDVQLDFAITASAGPGGSITPAGEVIVGFYEDQTFTITPDADYQIVDVLVDGVSQGPVSEYTFGNVNSDHTIRAVFASYDFYFAEGYTGAGFHEYLCIGNPGAAAANIAVTYMFTDGTTQVQEINVPASSRATIDVNTAVGAGREVSAKVSSDQPVVVERPMYFAYQGELTGGSDVVGASAPAQNWFFAEGYTGTGFDEYICVVNPGGKAADLTFRFQTQEEGEMTRKGYSVGPHTRGTFKVNDVLGHGYQSSLKLESSQPVVAERPMYFVYEGMWSGGHCVMGAPSLSRQFYFAEGNTLPDFREYLTLQNPNAEDITVDAVYQLGAGQGENVEKTYTIGAGERATVEVFSEVEAGKEVSVKLASESCFLAERPMYFDYNGWSGGHCVIGASSPGSEWYLAEGYTGAGFHEYLTLQNPGAGEATVEITYLTRRDGIDIVPMAQGAEVSPTRTLTVPAGSRQTVFVNADAGEDLQLSVKLRVTSGPDVVVERPMYFDYSGCSGGHDVVGFMP